MCCGVCFSYAPTGVLAEGIGLKCPKTHGTMSPTIIYYSKSRYPQGGYKSADTKTFAITLLSDRWKNMGKQCHTMPKGQKG